MRQVSESEERRAKNIIWNAAGDYRFTPDFLAFSPDGTADLYQNCIIGAVRRYYDYGPLEALFSRMKLVAEAVFYQDLFWFGLAHSVFPAAVRERPILEELRLQYAEDVLSRSRPYWDQEVLDRLRTAYCAQLLGKTARLRAKEKRLMKAILFDPEIDSAKIAARMEEILKEFFRCSLPQTRARRRPAIPFRLVMAAFHGPSSFVPARSEREESEGAATVFTLYLPAFRAKARARRQSWLEDNFGMSVYTAREQEELQRLLCTDGHRSCRLHVTRGEYRGTASRSSSSYRSAVQRQKAENLAFHHAHLGMHMIAISRMTDRIRNVLQADSGARPLPGRSGRLQAGRVWRAVFLNDDRIFSGAELCDKGSLSVDILLDASASQMDRQARIAAQGYIIAESLTRCRLPVRICSYCTVDGCTILRIFRDYEQPQDNEKIFEYCSAGWNRDGLAARLAGYRMMSSGYENRLLIILSDCCPNDDHRIYSSAGLVPFSYDYGGRWGIHDAAREISRLKNQGICVLAVCTGQEKDLPAAREIYGNDVVWAKTEDRFADAAAYLIRERIRRL